MCCLPYIFVQYAYSILSIVSGIVALIITVVVTAVTGFLTLARLDIRKISVPLVSRIMEPASLAFCAALMVDHDNTNPIKFMAIEWLCERLQALRKAEVRQHQRCIPVFVHVCLDRTRICSHAACLSHHLVL